MNKIILSLSFLTASCSYPEIYNSDGLSDKNISGIEIITNDIFYRGDRIEVSLYSIADTGEKTQTENSHIQWSSSDNTILKIDKKGVVEAVSPGTADIIAEMEDFRTVMEVTVMERPDFTLLYFNEIFYDAAGSDSGIEFIEIINFGNSALNISGFEIIDGSINSSPFKFPAETFIKGEEIILITASYDVFFEKFNVYPDFDGLPYQLNNSGEALIFKNISGEIIDIVYIEGGTDDWRPPLEWGSNNLPAAGEGFSIRRNNFSDSDCYNNWEEGIPSPGVK